MTPPGCIPTDGIVPGWRCCRCETVVNAPDRLTCKQCGHLRCISLSQPPAEAPPRLTPELAALVESFVFGHDAVAACPLLTLEKGDVERALSAYCELHCLAPGEARAFASAVKSRLGSVS